MLHFQRQIAVVKMDIEMYEWVVLPDMLTAVDLSGILNLSVEFHLGVS